MVEIISLLTPDFSSSIEGVLLFGVLVGLGLGIGFVAGMFGVGGGFLLVPSLHAMLGIPIELAAGSVTCYIVGTSTTGLIKHWKMGNVEPEAVLYMSFGSITGAVLGDILQDWLIFSLFTGNHIMFDRVMQVLFLLLLGIVAVSMWIKLPEHIERRSLLQRIPLYPKTVLHRAGLAGVSIPGLLLIGFIGGILTGLMGISGGIIFMPILIIAVGLSAHVAVGTSLGVVLAGSMAAVIKKGLSGSAKISLPIVLALLLASAIGVQLGTRIGRILHAERLKRYFSIVVVLAMFMVLFKFIRSIISQ
jgi:uncharacterized membrane protein YfcA